MYVSECAYARPFSSCWPEPEERTPCTTGTTIFMQSPVSCTFTDKIVTLENKKCGEGIYL